VYAEHTQARPCAQKSESKNPLDYDAQDTRAYEHAP
jgi:hypothetical protein